MHLQLLPLLLQKVVLLQLHAAAADVSQTLCRASGCRLQQQQHQTSHLLQHQQQQ
jgi:hypothetical protein